MLPFSHFEQGLPLDEFLTKHGSLNHKTRWHATLQAISLTPEQIATISSFTRQTNILILAGAWCGDCSSQCPVFDKMAQINPLIRVRYIDRDVHADAQKELQVNGGNRVPVVVFFSEDGFEVSRMGDKTLSRYRATMESMAGDGCATGIVKGTDSVFNMVIADWLAETERVQYILRLSGRLRTKHGD